MKEGWWVNFQTRRYVGLLCGSVDHEIAVRSHDNQNWLSIPASVVKEIGRFRPRLDRDDLLRFVMLECHLMRIRGHLTHVTVEFGAGDWSPIWNVLGRWGKRFACPSTILRLVNLRTGECREMTVAEVKGLLGGVKKKGLKRPRENLKKNCTFCGGGRC